MSKIADIIKHKTILTNYELLITISINQFFIILIEIVINLAS